MKKTATILILGIIIMISALVSSCGSSCGKGDLGPSKYYATELYGRVYDRDIQSEKISDTTVLRYDNLKISLRFSGKFYSEVHENFSFISSAYACSPAEPHSEEKIMNISIIANQDFDELHPAGTNLKDLFYVSKLYYSSKFTVDEFLKTIPNVQDLEFSLISAPDIQQEIKFTITVNYDGRLVKVLEYQTPTFIVTSL